MAFHDAALFPVEYSFGTSGGPAHETVIQQMPGGRGVYLPTVNEPVMRYEVDLSLLDPEHQRLGPLIDFIRARRGSTHGFRLWDYADHSTNALHIGEISAVDATARHEIGVGDGTTTVFSLAKTYTESGESVVRRIEKPMRVAEANLFTKVPYLRNATRTVWVWSDGSLQTEGVNYTLDYSTGKITFGTAPTAAKVIEWAGYFVVPVHLGAEADKFLRLTASSYAQRQTDTLTMVEEKSDTALLSLDRSPGGASLITLTEDSHQIEFYRGAAQHFDADGLMAAPTLLLPEPDDWMLGRDILRIFNRGATIGLDMRDHTGAALPAPLTIAAGYMARFHLAPDGSGGYDWVVS
jgi:uncharacterized protein (TIGR02217 family)